jgi:hypothetical protein
MTRLRQEADLRPPIGFFKPGLKLVASLHLRTVSQTYRKMPRRFLPTALRHVGIPIVG